MVDDPKGEASLDLWLDQKDDLLAGRTPRGKDEAGLIVADLCNRFLTPARRWNQAGDYGASDAFQILPLTSAADSIRGGHIRYAPDFVEVFSSTL